MALFNPDVVLFGDRAGFGLWLNAHWYEHQQFITIGLQQAQPIEFVAYDILGWVEDPQAQQSWLGAHSDMHDSLRQTTGVRGITLDEVDFGNSDAFNVWMNYHAQEHQQLRAAFGVA